MDQKYKTLNRLLIVLIGTNIICLFIIAFVIAENNLLQEKLLEMTENFRLLDEKISRIEATQNESLRGGKMVEKGNGYILGGVVIIIGIVTLIYFGGIDPGALGKALNLSSIDPMTDFVSQNKLIGGNLKLCLSSIDFMNRGILNEVASRTDFICTKLDVILNSIITKDLNLNSIFSNLNSERSDWE